MEDASHKNTSVFPHGHIDRSGWKRVRLGDVCEISKGEQLNRATLAEKGRIPVYNGGSSPSGYAEEANTDAESVIISEGGNSCGYVNFIHVPFWRGGHCYLLKTKLDKSLLYYVLKANESKIMSLRVGTGLPNIQRERLNAFEFDLPIDVIKQRQIVSAFASIDTHISALDALIAKYEAIKKATVNLLLKPKSGWLTSTMGESFDLSRGVVISKNEIERHPGIYPVYSSQSVNDGVLGLIDSYRYDGEYITWTTDGANAGTVFYRHGKFNCTNVCGIAKARIPKMSPAFVALMIAQHAKSYVLYVGNPKLMSNIFAQIVFSYPSASEQRKIAEQIAAIDNVLVDCKAQFEKARQLKAGMMSYFFG